MRAFISFLLFVIATANTALAVPPEASNRGQFTVAPQQSSNNAPAALEDAPEGSFIYRDTHRSLALLDGEILFGSGDFELTPEGRLSLDRLINKLQRFDAILSIRIIGHTDDAGDEEYNLGLSQRRADWIKARFIYRHPEAQIWAVGAGESAPLVSNSTLAGQERNRRVNVQVIATGKASFER